MSGWMTSQFNSNSFSFIYDEYLLFYIVKYMF